LVFRWWEDDACVFGSDHDATSAVGETLVWYTISCNVCGTYHIHRGAVSEIGKVESQYKGKEYLFSAIAKQAFLRDEIQAFSAENLESLLDSITPPETPREVLDHVLLYVAGKAPTMYAEVSVDSNTDFPIAFAKDAPDFELTLRDGQKDGLLTRGSGTVRLSSSGWERVRELRQVRGKPDQAFVAMWFHKDLDSVYQEGIKPALEEAGYHPIRVDKEQFNDKIDDHIVAEIRRSGILVADVTGHRQGVYFEAGFALGLGIPVVWTCKESEIGDAHFDTRQYNHITWSDKEELRQKLLDRLLAPLPVHS